MAGILLAVAAIVVPAAEELSQLELEKERLAKTQLQLQHNLTRYELFLSQVESGDSQIESRIQQMQFHVYPEGTPVVIDESAPKTPLQWINLQLSQPQQLRMESKEKPILVNLVKGTGRLWVAGGGILAIFFGCVMGRKQ